VPAGGSAVFGYATVTRRFGAWLADGVVIVVVAIIAGRALGEGVGSASASIGVWLFAPTYFTLCHGSRRGQTAGKAMLGIAVRHERTGERIGYGRALGRWLVTFLFWGLFIIPGILDALSAIRHDRNQAWHDRAAGTIVVNA